MLNSNERIIKHKVGLLNLAQELGTITCSYKDRSGCCCVMVVVLGPS